MLKKNLIRLAIGGTGVVCLATMTIVGAPAQQVSVSDQMQIADNGSENANVKQWIDFRSDYEKSKYPLTYDPLRKLSEEIISVEADVAVRVAANYAQIAETTQESVEVSEPAVEAGQPETDVQVLTAEAEPTPQPQVEVPVETSVEAPGAAEVDSITIIPVEPEPTPEPTPSIYSQEAQMASIQGGCTIMGTTYTYLDQMVRYYNKNEKYPEFYQNTDAPTIEAFCQIFLEEAEAEGVRAEVAFCQSMKETGFLRFTKDVSIEQLNFGGIGATGGGEPGYSFSSVREGVRAQIQHLKAYASTEKLKNKCVDPRFSYVKRGTIPYVEWLGIQESPNGGGWAAAENYGYSIIYDFMVKLFSY